MATDKEVEDAREAVIELRSRVEAARTGGAEKLATVDNDIQMAQFATEAAKLETELMVLQQNNKVTVIRAGAAPVLDTVKEQMAAAVAANKATAAEVKTASRSSSTVTPTDSASSNTTTDAQAANKASTSKEGAK